jgi:hypothetical protein
MGHGEAIARSSTRDNNVVKADDEKEEEADGLLAMFLVASFRKRCPVLRHKAKKTKTTMKWRTDN